MIDRHNILDLLGGDKRKYHSCIITCYSFDFIFFEQRVLPKLRHAGITNVNIYVDAHQFEKQINQFVGNDLLDRKAGYSITPVKMIGAFHPKVLLAVGKTKGFLAIGSGNLTSSGLSSNEEIWGSFHITETDKATEPFFRQTAKYLQKLEEFVYGTSLLKLKWIKENSVWYRNILEGEDSTKIIAHKDQNFEILITYQNKSIYKSLKERLPKKPKNIKILSPYYNTDGSFLKTIINDFQPEKIHCIVDPMYGSIPYKLENEFDIEFSEWNKLKRIEKYSKNRLHAKAMQFEYENETYFIFGSANATSEAFGVNLNNSVNAEIIILAYGNKSRDYFKELGINFPKKGNYLLQDYVYKGKNELKENEKLNFLLFIKYVEIEGNEVNIYIENEINESVEICIEDGNGTVIFAQSVNFLEIKTTIIYENENQLVPFRLAIYKKTERISNFALIHQKAFLLNTNPDARIAHLNSLLEFTGFGDDELNDLLEFIHLKSDFASSSIVSKYSVKSVEYEDDEIVEIISEEEFNKNNSSVNLDGNFSHYSSSRIEEFLNSLNFENPSTEDVSESVEDAALAAGLDGLDDGTKSIIIQKNTVPFETGVRITYYLERTIEKIIKALSPQKAQHLRNKDPQSLATLHQINALLIGFHLILKKRNETFQENRSIIKLQFTDINKINEIEKQFRLLRQEIQIGNLKNEITFSINENDVSKLIEFLQVNQDVIIKYVDETASLSYDHHYFSKKFWSNEEEKKSINSYLKNGLSVHLLLLTKEVEIKEEKEKLIWIEKKKRLKSLSICSIISYHWNSANERNKILLLLNIFHLLGNKEDLNTFQNEIEHYIDKLNLSSFISDESYVDLLDLYSEYIDWSEEYESNPTKLKKELSITVENSIVFNKKYGFATLLHCYENKFVNLESPLGINIEKKEFRGFEEVFIGSSPVFF